MADNPVPPPSNPPPAKPVPAPASRSAGHLPITEELDSAKWTMPPFAMLGLAILLVGLVLFIVYLTNRPKPTATGVVKFIVASDQKDSVLVAVGLKFDNKTDQMLWIKNLKSEMQAADGQKYSDSAAPAVDVDRYLPLFPQLRNENITPLKEEMKIPPKGAAEGLLIFAYPVAKSVFDARKSLRVRVEFYDRPAMVLTE